MANPTPPATPPSTLPSASSPTLKLVPGTREQARQCWSLNGESWRGPLTQEQYVRREEHLGSQTLMRDGGATYWILVDTADKRDNPTILASCESYRKRALVSKRKTSDDGSSSVGVTQKVITHGIGSVYCRDQFRGKGYAGRMMDELRGVLETWQQQRQQQQQQQQAEIVKEGTGQGGVVESPTDAKALFNVLYSDIGKNFYAKRGWIPFPSSHISLAATSDAGTSTNNLPPTRPLYEADLPNLCELDEQQLTAAMSDFSGSPASAKVRVAMVPDIATIRWMHAREEFLSRELDRANTDVKGVMVDGPAGQRVWCIWTRKFADESEPEEQTLHLSRLVIEGAPGIRSSASGSESDGLSSSTAEDERRVRAIAACLHAARLETARVGLRQVEVWNPSGETLRASEMLQQGVELVHRQEESIASLLWYGSEIVPDELDWVGNEKYGWC